MISNTHSPLRHRGRRSARLTVGDRLVVLLMFFLPIPSFLGDLAARAADAVRFGAVSGRLLATPRSAWGGHVWVVSAVLLTMFLSACASMFFGFSHTLRDLLDVTRIAAFWSVFLFGASLAWRGRFDPRTGAVSCLKLLLAIGALNALFTAGQHWFPNLTHPLQELFSTGDRHMELLAEQGRAFGIFVNPNTNAVMVLLLALPGLALYQLTSQRKYLFLGVLVFASVLLTASRTGLVVAVVMVGVLGTTSLRPTYVAALAAAAWGACKSLDYLVDSGNVKIWFPYLSELLIKTHDTLHGDYFDVESINSFSGRLTIWNQSLAWYHMNPLLGSGPLRDVIPSYADNYYVYLLSRYGIIGLSLYIIFSIYVAGLSVRAILSRRSPHKQWGMLTLTALVAVNVSNYTMDAFLIVPIAMLILLYSGYLTSLMDMPSPSQGMKRLAQGRRINSRSLAQSATSSMRRVLPASVSALQQPQPSKRAAPSS